MIYKVKRIDIKNNIRKCKRQQKNDCLNKNNNKDQTEQIDIPKSSLYLSYTNRQCHIIQKRRNASKVRQTIYSRKR